MSALERLGKGETVWLPCESKTGMFPTERYFLVSMPTTTVSGFIPSEEVRGKEGEYQVRAIIAGQIDDNVTLLFRGDLLSTTNPVIVPGVWLTSTGTFEMSK